MWIFLTDSRCWLTNRWCKLGSFNLCWLPPGEKNKINCNSGLDWLSVWHQVTLISHTSTISGHRGQAWRLTAYVANWAVWRNKATRQRWWYLEGWNMIKKDIFRSSENMWSVFENVMEGGGFRERGERREGGEETEKEREITKDSRSWGEGKPSLRHTYSPASARDTRDVDIVRKMHVYTRGAFRAAK